MNSVTFNREALLKESQHFCMIPWVHMHFWPSAEVFPCCIADSSKPLGKYGESSIEQIWNSPNLRAIRKNMLEDKPSAECGRCYALERDTKTYTLRKMSNYDFAHHFDKVETTQQDGSVPAVNMPYLDIRFSNLCNFRCHTCGPRLSSSWYEDQSKIVGGDPGHPKLIQIQPSELFWKELEPVLMGVEQCYFAGGEPLLCEEHFRILDFWIERGKFDAQITYTTNFSQLEFRGRSALDYWRKFPKVRVSASLDASGPRAEYLRKGTNWKRIEENRLRMLRECPEVYFEITPTIGAFNVFHFPDFHLDWVKRGLLEANAIRLNVLTYPANMGISLLPQKLKREAARKYRRARDVLLDGAISANKPHHQIQNDYDSVIGLLDQPEPSPPELAQLRKEFHERMSMMDRIRNENLVSVFPELGVLFV